MILTGFRIRRILGLLPARLRAELRRVRIEHRPHPNEIDRARGAGAETRGYFFGHAAEQLEGETTALPETAPPEGTIVIFSARVDSTDELARVLLHELGHALGFDHDVIEGELCL